MPSDLPLVGVLITSTFGFVLGFLGWWRDRQRDKSNDARSERVARAAAKDETARANESAMKVVRAALDVAAGQIRDLTVQVAEVPRLRAEIIQLRVDHEMCEARNQLLTERVHELEQAR